jgi:hypothetical protein
MRYPEYAAELMQLLRADQTEKRDVGQAYFNESDQTLLDTKSATLKQNTRERTARMLQIFEEIGQPSISNIGAEAAQAISVLAVHDTPNVLRRVLYAFNKLYKQDKSDTYYQAIPSMTDWVLVRESKPQRFGTQWMFDKDKQPFLPTVEDFEHVNDRRAEYDIEPFRWVKSLAIPESEQPWLKQPLSELVMRDPTTEERKDLER